MKPEPKPTNVVCTVCGLSWDAHESAAPAKGKKKTVTLEDCVRVLKIELQRRPTFLQPHVTGTTGLTTYGGLPLRGNDIGKAQ